MEIEIYKWTPVIIAGIAGLVLGFIINSFINKPKKAPESYGNLIVSVPKEGLADMYMQLNIDHTLDDIINEKSIILDVITIKD